MQQVMCACNIVIVVALAPEFEKYEIKRISEKKYVTNKVLILHFFTDCLKLHLCIVRDKFIQTNVYQYHVTSKRTTFHSKRKIISSPLYYNRLCSQGNAGSKAQIDSLDQEYLMNEILLPTASHTSRTLVEYQNSNGSPDDIQFLAYLFGV